MFKRVLAAFLIAVQGIAPAAAMSHGDGQYYFRYRVGGGDPSQPSNPNDGNSQTKDITAYYIGGVGKVFSEKLPMKPEWQDDNWRVTKGSLPAGISFNSGTLTFEGTPENVVSDVQVELTGFDAENNGIASAVAHFSVYQLPDKVVNVDFYTHTNKQASFPLNLPAGVVIDGDPKLLSSVPPGVIFNARYFDGVPTKAGVYPVLAIGYDFLGKAVVAFTGRYTVEDGPTFATKIADNLQPLTRSEYWGCVASECAVWFKSPTPKVANAIKDASKIRYLVEVKDGDVLPGTLAFTDGPYQLQVTGRTYAAFDQATIRYKAIDTDGTVGYSNWFKIGSLGPSATCKPLVGQDAIILTGTVGAAFQGTGYKVPTGYDNSTKKFTQVGGTLPEGLTLDSDTGLLSGKPVKKEVQKGITVEITYTNNSSANATQCGPYEISIQQAPLKLSAVGLKAQYRVGEAVDVQMVPDGAKIDPWSVTIDDSAVLPPGISYDAATQKLSGVVSEAGQFSANFTLTNGDGVLYRRGVVFSGNGNVDIDDVPATTAIKQYDTEDQLIAISYDPATIIGAGSETLSLVGGPLPDGITFDTGMMAISGGTRLPVDKYGPFKIRLADSTGNFDETNDFYIDVTARDDLKANATISPTFSVNLQDVGQQPFSVTQPPLAKGYLPLKYTLSPDVSTLPEGLTFSDVTGEISGTPLRKATLPGYTVTISEIGPDNLSKTSDPFTIEITDPPAIKDQELTKLQGNVGGPFVTSLSPTPVLASIRSTLVGGEQSVVFDSAEPSIGGLSMANGMISGKASEEFDGTVTIHYHDAANREGKLLLPVSIYPFPALTSNQTAYELPRLSLATDISVYPANSGYYGGVSYTLQSGQLPAGLTLANGVISGSTTAAADTVYNLVIRGTSKANGLFADRAITIKVQAEKPMTLDVKTPSNDDKLWFMLDETTMSVKDRGWFVPAPAPGGSFTGKISWTLGNAPAWMSVDTTGQIAGKPPRLGEWTIDVIATDAEGHTAKDDIIVKASLYGVPAINPGDQSLIVRQGESFATEPQAVSNAVNPISWEHSGNRPDTVSFDNSTGVFTGRIDDAGIATWKLDAVDADERHTKPSSLISVYSTPRLDVPSAVSVQNGKQYDAKQPIEIQFAAAKNVMGKATYDIDGNVPGTLYYKFYDNDDPSKLATYVGASGSVRQLYGEDAATTEARLSPDHMIFDTIFLTLRGIPSSYGTFQVTMTASDDHQQTGYRVNPADSTKKAYNEAQSPNATVTVAKAEDLQIANNMDAEALYQYTSQPTLKTTVSNDAYGLGVTWASVRGSYPNKVNPYQPTPQVLAYTGYPDTQGTWNDLVWKATDRAGRSINSGPVSFTVGPRLPLAVVASAGIPRPMVVFSQDADLWVTAENRADGKSIGISNWSITGADQLPPGVAYDLKDDGFHFYGKSNVIGDYTGITITAKDSRGATASKALSFKVISDPAEIQLDVADIKTKAGYPVAMQPPFAAAALSTANTYGSVRFYSNNLASVASSLSLNGGTGAISGTLSKTQQFTFDLYVTDDTNRVTSKPVTVEVIPNVRVIAPTLVSLEQGKTQSVATATDYVVGKVTYTKGAGNWPDGVSVDPDTGAVVGPATGAVGDYPGLTIVAKDTFGAYADTQSSNAFTVQVDPIQAAPDIEDIANSKLLLGTVGDAAVPFTPKVVDTILKKDWTYGGLTFTLNRTLPKGVSFDSKSGTFSGTPEEAIIIRDLTITVTSDAGDTDTTKPFWFGVEPAGNLGLGDFKTAYDVRAEGGLWTSQAPVVTNLVGNMTWTRDNPQVNVALEPCCSYQPDAFNYMTSLNTDGSIWSGRYGWTMVDPARKPYSFPITGTDEFGRKINVVFSVKLVNAPTLAYAPGTITAGVATTITAVKSDLSNATGYSSNKPLPTGFVLNQTTGDIEAASGVNISAVGDSSGFVITATESNGNVSSAAFNLRIVAPTLTYATAAMNTGDYGVIAPTKPNFVAGTVYSVNKSLPTGLTLDTSTGEIKGTPAADNTASGFVVTATGSWGSVSSPAFSITSSSAAKYTYWAVIFSQNMAGQTGWSGTPNVTMQDFLPLNAAGDVLQPTRTYTYYNAYNTAAMTDGNPSTVFTDTINSGAVFHYESGKQLVSKVKFVMTGSVYDPKTVYFCKSDTYGWAVGAFFANCTANYNLPKPANGAAYYAPGEVVTMDWPQQ